MRQLKYRSKLAFEKLYRQRESNRASRALDNQALNLELKGEDHSKIAHTKAI